MVQTVFLGKYELVRPLGEGSMGRVYLCKERTTGREVVVKVMTEEAAAQPLFREFFEREAQLLTAFHHPNVVSLIEASADASEPCLVMEYVDGTTVAELLREFGRFTPGQVGKLLGPLCSAVHAAHSAGIIHRDLKPDNLMVANAGTDEQTLKVMDFGLATLAGAVYISLEKLKGDPTAFAAGTPEYMPPEHIRGDDADHRADIYSMGVILYEMLTGRVPFEHNSVQALFDSHTDDKPPTFAAVGADNVPPALERVVMMCLAKFPAERPQSAWELANLFGKALGVRLMDPPAKQTMEAAPAAGRLVSAEVEQAVVREMHAFMPERLAVSKLRGFVDDVGGELVDSVPGAIRMRLGGGDCRYQPPALSTWAWLGLDGKSRQIDVELRLAKTDPSHSAQLHITMLLRPAKGGSLPQDPRWLACCERIYTDLRGYLMAD